MSQNKGQTTHPHSIRFPDRRWYAAKARAGREGVSLSTVVNEFVEGYAKGDLDRPNIQTRYTIKNTRQGDQ